MLANLIAVLCDFNQFARIRTYVSSEYKNVVRISVNSLWSVAFLDLDKEPISCRRPIWMTATSWCRRWTVDGQLHVGRFTHQWRQAGHLSHRRSQVEWHGAERRRPGLQVRYVLRLGAGANVGCQPRRFRRNPREAGPVEGDAAQRLGHELYTADQRARRSKCGPHSHSSRAGESHERRDVLQSPCTASGGQSAATGRFSVEDECVVGLALSRQLLRKELAQPLRNPLFYAVEVQPRWFSRHLSPKRLARRGQGVELAADSAVRHVQPHGALLSTWGGTAQRLVQTAAGGKSASSLLWRKAGLDCSCSPLRRS